MAIREIDAKAQRRGGPQRERDVLVAVWDWFRAAGLAGRLWIPAFAGMTGGDWERENGFAVCGSGLVSGGGLGWSTLDSRFRGNDGGIWKGRMDLRSAIRAWFRAAGLCGHLWIPAFAGMTGGIGQGRGDALVAIRVWFRVADLSGRLWIPAFAGMTGGGGQENREKEFTPATRRLWRSPTPLPGGVRASTAPSRAGRRRTRNPGPALWRG